MSSQFIPFDGKTLERFWAKVDRGNPDDCWEWNAHRVRGGYGRIWAAGRHWMAHRLSWSIHNGPIPDGLMIRHTCDNPPCVNPGHLLVGTRADNGRDVRLRGRKRGMAHNLAILTDKDVLFIRRAFRLGIRPSRIARRLNVSESVVYSVRSRKTWTHI